MKKEQECNKIKVGQRDGLVRQGFICCWLQSENEKPMKRCWVKLDQVKSIQEAGFTDEGEVNAIFTYRDHWYYVFMNAELIIDAINEFSSKEAENERAKPVITRLHEIKPIEC